MVWILLMVAASDYSLRLAEPFTVPDLDRVPSSGSYENVLENVVAPAILSEPESGGFSKVDLQRISLNADSHLWTGWRIDGFDLEDPLWNGAAALHVPYALLGSMSVYEREATDHPGGGSIELHSRAADGLHIQVAGVDPNLGGLFPPAVPAMNALSGSHDTLRLHPPPEQRRRFSDSAPFLGRRRRRQPDLRRRSGRENERRFLNLSIRRAAGLAVHWNLRRAVLARRRRRAFSSRRSAWGRSRRISLSAKSLQ